MMHFDPYTSNTPTNLKDEYRTPEWVFDPLNEIFNFTLDPAATRDNKLCDKYYTPRDNGLTQPWGEETVFCNPPFTDGKYGEWLDKAQTEFQNNAVTSVMLVPFNAETSGFYPVWDTPAHYLVLPNRRINYLSPMGAVVQGAKFYSCLAVFTYMNFDYDDFRKLKRIGRVIDLYKGLHG